MDGGDNETRRRGACDLLRGMCKHFEEPTTRICSTFVSSMYQEYATNPSANWRSKDAAVREGVMLFLCVGICVCGGTFSFSRVVFVFVYVFF